MPSFISEYTDFTKELESPTSFFQWSCYTCVGAALRYNVWLTQGPRNVYPNIYTLLIADSGISRKSVPLEIVSRLLRLAGATKVISGHSSIQAVLIDLVTPVTNEITGKQILGGACLLSAEELAAFFTPGSEAMTLLTDIYDYRDVYQYNLKSKKEKIEHLCVSMLAASNEVHLRTVYTQQHVYGGLMGRTFFIKSDGRRPPNPLLDSMSSPVNGHYDISNLVRLLKDVTTLRGKFQVYDDAAKEYVTWYNSLHEEYANKVDRSGVIARIHTGVLKLAMILAAGHTMLLEIRKEHIQEAINHCQKILPNYEVFTMSAGRATDSQLGADLFSELLDPRNNNKISRRSFIRNHWTDLEELQFNALTERLMTAKLITATFDATGDAVFSLTEIGREIVKKQIENHKKS